MSNETNKATIRRWVEEAWNKGNVDIAYEIYAPEYVAFDHDTGQKICGPAGIRQFVLKFRSDFPDINFQIKHLIAEENKVVGIFTITGMFDKLTDEEIVCEAVDVWKFNAAGMIVKRCFVLLKKI
jgi:predicted ester cyclase